MSGGYHSANRRKSQDCSAPAGPLRRNQQPLLGVNSSTANGLRGAMLRNEQQLSAARQAFDKAMQVKQAFMREKDRKTNEAMQALRLLSRTEGIIPAIESAHALAGALELGRELGPDGLIIVNLSGRGDKDMDTAAQYFGLYDEGAQR